MNLQEDYNKLNEILNKTNEEVENIDFQISKLQKQKQEKLDAINYLRGQIKATVNISDKLAAFYESKEEYDKMPEKQNNKKSK